MSDIEDNFEVADTGAPTYPIQCSALRENGYVMLHNRPCKIAEMSSSSPGKHGNAKVHLVGHDIFTGEKMEEIWPSTHNIDVPNVKRVEYTLIDVQDGFLSLMDENGDVRDDIKLPENDLGSEIVRKFDEGDEMLICVLSALGEEMAIGIKNVAQK